MRTRLAVQLSAAILISVSAVNRAFACQCGVRFRGKNAWEVAKLESENSAVIFEGTPVRFELKWNLLTAKESELIPSDVFSAKDWDREPQMAVTFRVFRIYKGKVGAEVQLYTGLGGGDCGATYMPGLNYLVCSAGPSLDRLGVSMCSPGGWVEGAEAATDLRYLPKERPIATDLAPILHWSQAGWDKQQEQQRRFAESRKKFEEATGKICGKLVHADPKENGEGSIAFLSTLGYSPNSPDFAELKDDGTFCSRNLGPRKYYLYFVRHDDHGVSALYYPGVTDVAKATPVEVRAAQTQSNIVFHVPTQPSYSIRGFVSADDKSAFDSGLMQISIGLIRSDGDRRIWYAAKSQFRLLPKLGYFKFENVVPGRYFVFVQGRTGWMSRRTTVDVTNHSKFISVNLVSRK
jgi:hypothetical protein